MKWEGQDFCKNKTTYMKYKVMRKKHLTNKVLDLHMHACASAQSDQGLWVFTEELEQVPRGSQIPPASAIS